MSIKNIFVALVVLCSTGLSAQHFGIRAGANLANQNWSNDFGNDLSNKTGFYAGIFGDFVMHWNLHAQLGVDYVQKGAIRIDTENIEEAIGLNYIEAPILLKYMIDVSDYNQMYITAGATLGYALDGMIGDDEVDFETEGINQFELGASFGLGFGFKVGEGLFSLEARYGFGLTDYFEDKNLDYSVKNKGISVGIAHMF